MKYTISKGNHYNDGKIRMITASVFGAVSADLVVRGFNLHLSSELGRYVRFPKNAWYPRSAVEYTGYNKLVGFGGLNIHKYSARIVWQPDFNRPGYINTYLYVYGHLGNKWESKFITSVKTGEVIKLSVSAEEAHYMGIVNDVCKILPADKTPHFIKAEPYFGGKSTAPYDITIEMWKVWYYERFIR